MPNTSKDRSAELLPTYDAQPAASRMRQVYFKGDNEDAERYHNLDYQAHGRQSAAEEHQQWHGIELTPMLVGTILCGVFALWPIWAALH